MSKIKKELCEYMDLIDETLADIKSGLEMGTQLNFDDADGKALKSLLAILTLGKYLKERFNDELMDNLERASIDRTH